MNNKMTSKLAILTSAIALLSTMSINAQAAQYGNAPVQAAPVQAAPAMPAPRPAYGYPNRGPAPAYGTPWGGNRNMPWSGNRNMPWGGNNNMPWGGNRSMPWSGNNNMPWGGNRSMPWGGNNNMPWGGNRYGNSPRGGNRFGGMPWGGNNNRKGFGRGMPFESNFTPWSERFWDDLGKGGKNPMNDMDEWFRPGDPKEGVAEMWDDLLNAPSDMGRMPGGWSAPSISVPNPVDVGEEFSDAARDMPDEMSNQMDNINIQTW